MISHHSTHDYDDDDVHYYLCMACGLIKLKSGGAAVGAVARSFNLIWARIEIFTQFTAASSSRAYIHVGVGAREIGSNRHVFLFAISCAFWTSKSELEKHGGG
jgi:hypothetical protein